MKLRMMFGFGVAVLFVLSSFLAAQADFQYVRSIPAPESRCGAGHITGLDFEPEHGFLDLTVVCPDTAGKYSSYFYTVDPGTGYVRGHGAFVDPPLDCTGLKYHAASCASQFSHEREVHDFWMGDSCGCITRFTWSGEGNIGTGNIVAHGLVSGAPSPVGLEMEFGTGTRCGTDLLYIGDAVNEWIVVCDAENLDVLGTIPVPDVGGPRSMKSVTLCGDRLFVSFMVSSIEITYPLIIEMSKTGEYIQSHNLLGRWSPPEGIAFVGDSLYVAGPGDSIAIYAPAGFESEIPAGDSIVVNVVPDEITVAFDSVSTSGLMVASVGTTDSCPAPEGVSLFAKFYEIATDAQFDYAAEVEVGMTEPLPGGVDAKNVRVFVRPSGPCQVYRDITTAPTEMPGVAVQPLSVLTRTISEDDEFSVFALGEDLRSPRAVVELKFTFLKNTIDAFADSIPSPELARLNTLLIKAVDAYYRGLSLEAAVLADSIAAVVRSTPQIPHTYVPLAPGRNIAGRLISEAHTLSFSLRFSAGEARLAQAVLEPNCVNFSYDGWVLAVIDVPSGLGSVVDPQHVFLMHSARAVPDSVRADDFDRDGVTEILALFRASAVKDALRKPGESIARLSCFIEGWEVFADVAVSWLGVARGAMGEGSYLASGVAGRAGLSIRPNPSRSTIEIEFTPAAGTGPVEVSIYSVTGELVKTLQSGPASGGTYVLSWNGDNLRGAAVSAGTYFVVARQGEERYTGKVILRP